MEKKPDVKVSEKEIELLNKLKEKKIIGDDNLEKIIKNISSINPKKYNSYKIDIPDKHIKFIMFSDAHLGHQDYRPDVLRKMIKDGKRKGVEFYLNGGDTIEGMSGREGHIYELTHIGASAQLNYFSEEFKKFNKPVYSIEAQNSHGGWFKSKGNMGLDIGEELDSRAKNYKFIGYDEQDIEFDNGLKVRLRHPGGGTAYALSYKMQKYIESISGGDKPHLLGQGHFHKADYIFYRNIHGVDLGALQDQSPFLKKMGSPSHVCYWIIDVNMNKQKQKGIERINFEMVPFYD